MHFFPRCGQILKSPFYAGFLHFFLWKTVWKVWIFPLNV